MNDTCIMCGAHVEEGFGFVCPACEADVKDGRVPSQWEALQINSQVRNAPIQAQERFKKGTRLWKRKKRKKRSAEA